MSQSKNVKDALSYISERDETFADLVKSSSITRAVYTMLHAGGFSLEKMHHAGDLRRVLDALL